jgi:hypothetical protein
LHISKEKQTTKISNAIPTLELHIAPNVNSGMTGNTKINEKMKMQKQIKGTDC